MQLAAFWEPHPRWFMWLSFSMIRKSFSLRWFRENRDAPPRFLGASSFCAIAVIHSIFDVKAVSLVDFFFRTLRAFFTFSSRISSNDSSPDVPKAARNSPQNASHLTISLRLLARWFPFINFAGVKTFPRRRQKKFTWLDNQETSTGEPFELWFRRSIEAAASLFRRTGFCVLWRVREPSELGNHFNVVWVCKSQRRIRQSPSVIAEGFASSTNF